VHVVKIQLCLYFSYDELFAVLEMHCCILAVMNQLPCLDCSVVSVTMSIFSYDESTAGCYWKDIANALDGQILECKSSNGSAQTIFIYVSIFATTMM